MCNVAAQKGFSLISILAVLLIGGLLYVGYTSLGSTQNVTSESPARLMSVPKGAACEMNRRAIEKALLNWTVRNPGQKPSLKALEAAGVTVPGCPEGGRFQLVGDKITCSLHKDR